MKRRSITALTAVALGAAAFAGTAATTDDDPDIPITGSALESASQAALDHVGEGTVTATEVGDEESLYEVEVTREDGSQIDVQLDEGFTVVGDEEDGTGDTDD